MSSDPLLTLFLLSALQHWAYCPRRCALIHVEQVFEENLFTQRGQALHKRVDDPGFELRDGAHRARPAAVLRPAWAGWQGGCRRVSAGWHAVSGGIQTWLSPQAGRHCGLR